MAASSLASYRTPALVTQLMEVTQSMAMMMAKLVDIWWETYCALSYFKPLSSSALGLAFLLVKKQIIAPHQPAMQ